MAAKVAALQYAFTPKSGRGWTLWSDSFRCNAKRHHALLDAERRGEFFALPSSDMQNKF